MFYLELHTEKEVGRVGFETVLLEYGTSNVHQLVNEETKLFLVVTLLEAENDTSRSVLFFSLIQHFTNRVSQLDIVEFTSSDVKGTSTCDEVIDDNSFPTLTDRRSEVDGESWERVNRRRGREDGVEESRRTDGSVRIGRRSRKDDLRLLRTLSEFREDRIGGRRRSGRRRRRREDGLVRRRADGFVVVGGGRRRSGRGVDRSRK